MALILTNLVSSWDDVREGTCVESTDKSCWTTASTLAVLQQIHDAALAPASERSPHSDFMELFLTAHATLNVVRVVRQMVSADSFRDFIASYLPRLIVYQRNEPQDREIKGLATVSKDPALTLNPRSSVGSEFRSMFSMRRRISSTKAVGNTASENASERQTVQSSGSWSLRYQIDLSRSSYRNLSSKGTSSVQSTSTDRGPAVSHLQEGRHGLIDKILQIWSYANGAWEQVKKYKRRKHDLLRVMGASWWHHTWQLQDAYAVMGL